MNHCPACAGHGHRAVDTTSPCRSCGGSGHAPQFQQPTNRNGSWVGGGQVVCHDCRGQGSVTTRQYGACPDCAGRQDTPPPCLPVDTGDGGRIVIGPGFFRFLAWLVVLGLAAWGLWSAWNGWQARAARSAAADQRAALEQRGIPYLTGEWSGRYACAQGLTAARLELTSQVDGTVAGRFEFSPYAGTRGGRGAFQVAGTPQGDSVVLRGGKWIHQPAGYQAIDLRVTLAKGPPRRLAGQVLMPGCGAVELQEVRSTP